jgi:hypothetical protein
LKSLEQRKNIFNDKIEVIFPGFVNIKDFDKMPYDILCLREVIDLKQKLNENYTKITKYESELFHDHEIFTNALNIISNKLLVNLSLLSKDKIIDIFDDLITIKQLKFQYGDYKVIHENNINNYRKFIKIVNAKLKKQLSNSLYSFLEMKNNDF